MYIMRLLFLVLLFSGNLFAKGKFEVATILYNDGHKEEGFIKIKSFLDGYAGSAILEKDLNLDDKSFEFKTTENSEVKVVYTDNVKQVTLKDEKGNDFIYEVVLLKELDKYGNVEGVGTKVYLQPVKKGKINVYGIRYRETGAGQPYLNGNEYRFYYQNTKENFAINYSGLTLSGLFNFKERMINPLRELCKDCPEALEFIDKKINPDKFDEKEVKAEEKRLKKEFKALTDNQKADLSILHFYEVNLLEQLIDKYEKCN